MIQSEKFGLKVRALVEDRGPLLKLASNICARGDGSVPVAFTPARFMESPT